MATSPSPNSSPSADPPMSTTAPPPETLSPPPAPLTSTLSPPPAPRTSTLSPPPVPLTSSSQHNASSPTATPTTPSQTPSSTNLTASPPVPPSPLPSQPPISSPPPPPAPSSNPPESSPPPPSLNPSSSSPTPTTPSPLSTSPPPPLDLPARSPPPLLPNPPTSPPRPPSPKTPARAPAKPSEPTKNTPPSPKALASPPAAPSEPSKNTPPPPSQPTEKSPPASPSFKPPKISLPPEPSKPPQSPPLPEPTEISPPPSPTPIVTPPPASPDSPPSSTIRHKLSPPSPMKQLSPPPPSLVPPSSPSPPPPSQGPNPIPPTGNLTTNTFGTPSNSNSTENSSTGAGGTVAIGLVLGLILLSLIVTAIWCVRKRKRKFTGLNGDHVILTSLSSSPKSDSALIKMQTSGAHNGSRTRSDFVYSSIEHGGLGNSRSWFTYQELVNATNGFSMQNLLGEGGFGSVYKGYLFGGREVAVKQLKIGGGQGEREFKAEVDIISRVHHRHLVSLVGYCISENQRLLVYDYVPNNNLYFHLHGEGRPVMEWATRVKAAAGAARGIAYLHEDCHPRIIHRDIKSSNILLDNSFEAQVSDFGLAKLALEANTHITTRVIGTFGYMAPEYASSGKLTEKSDVYSFGVVLLELITGRKPVDTSQPLGDESLVEWARPLLNLALDNEDFKALADPRLENNYVGSEMFRIIEAAAACVRHSAARRPRMGQVVRAFDSMATSDLTNGMRVGESEIFDSAQQSAEIRLFRRMTFGSQDYSTNSFRQNSWNS